MTSNPASVGPASDGPHADTADLIDRFCAALKAKLAAAEEKYGYGTGWKDDDWRDDLISKLARHVEKGDPRDVAAYCAFAWHHQWSIAPHPDREAEPRGGVVEHEHLSSALRQLRGRSATGRWIKLNYDEGDAILQALSVSPPVVEGDLGAAVLASADTVSVESVAKIIRREMQDGSVPATSRSERAAKLIAAHVGAGLRRARETDPMERLTAAALKAAGLAFITDHEPTSPARLDFYLPGDDIHIEVKRFHSERVTEQLRRADNVILLQGAGAVRFFASMLTTAPDTALADTQPGIFALRENDPKDRHQPTAPGEQGEEGA